MAHERGPVGGTGNLPLRERLRFMRAAALPLDPDESLFTPQDTPTDSSVPAIVYLAESPANPSTTGSSMAATSPSIVGGNQSQGQPAGESNQLLGLLDSPMLGEMEYIVPLAMSAEAVRCYEQALDDNREKIDRYVAQPNPTKADRDDVPKVMERIRYITLDPHLGASDAGDIVALTGPGIVVEGSENAVQGAEKVVGSSSTKIAFLRHLFKACRTRAMHIIIFAQLGRAVDLLYRFLSRSGVKFHHPHLGKRSAPDAKGRVKASILLTGDRGTTYVLERADLVVAFDHTFNAKHPQVINLRKHPLDLTRPAPVIHLLVANSVEHIGRHIPSGHVGRTRRRRTIMDAVVRCRSALGRLPEEHPRPEEAAEAIVRFVMHWENNHRVAGDWPLPSLPPLLMATVNDAMGHADRGREPHDARVGSKRSLVKPRPSVGRHHPPG